MTEKKWKFEKWNKIVLCIVDRGLTSDDEIVLASFCDELTTLLL